MRKNLQINKGNGCEAPPSSSSSPTRNWTVAIVGGETHLKEITTLEGMGLVIKGAVVRKDQTDWARQAFQSEIYPTVDELMEAQSPRIIVVANENHQKAEIIQRALAEDCHVIADKPAAVTLDELSAIEVQWTKHNSRILMLLTLRGNAQYRKLKELVESGAIGEPIQCQAKMSVELKPEARPPWFLDQRLSGGPILDLAIHSIDALEWITGLRLRSVISHQSHQTRLDLPELIDCGASFFSFENGGTAFVQFNRVLPKGCGNDYRFDIVGTTGQIEFRLNKYLRVRRKGNVMEDFSLGDLPPSQSVVADWLKSLDDPHHNPLVPDSASFRANRIACLAQLSADSGKIVSIND